MAEELLPIKRASVRIQERVAVLESEIKHLNESHSQHIIDDKEQFNKIQTTLEQMDVKLDTIALGIARQEGKEEATTALAKSAGGRRGATLGAIGGGFIAVILWFFRNWLGGNI